LLQCSFYENLKNWCKNRFFRKNSKQFVYCNEEIVYKFKFQTQLSQKRQRFRTCRKNKKCSIFHDLFEYSIFSYCCKLLNWSFKLLQVSLNLYKNDTSGGFLCKESIARIGENASQALIQGKGWVCIEAKMNKNSNFRSKTGYLGVFLGHESIARIFKTWKNYPDTDLSYFSIKTLREYTLS
jgi:hypothetical protein